MRLGDLVKSLSKLDPELEVLCYSEDPVPVDGRQFSVFDPQDVALTTVMSTRDDAGFVILRHASGEGSKQIALIGLSIDY